MKDNHAYGNPEDDFPILFNSKSRVVMSAGYNRGTVKLPPNFCPECGKPSRLVSEDIPGYPRKK